MARRDRGTMRLFWLALSWPIWRPNFSRRASGGVVVGLLVSLVMGCGGDTATTKANKPESGQAPPDAAVELAPEDNAKHLQAVALMAQHRLGDAEPILRDLASRYAGNENVLVDDAIVTMHAEKGGRPGIEAFEKIVERFPKSQRARFGLAYCLSMNDRPAEAIVLFEAVFQSLLAENADGRHSLSMAHCAYKLGDCLETLRRDEEAGPWLAKAVELDPFFYNAAFKWAQSLRLAGKAADAKKAAELANQLRNHPYLTIAAGKHRRMGPLLDVLPLADRLRASAPSVAETSSGRPVFAPSSPLGLGDWKGLPTDRATVTVCDVNADGRLDLFFASAFRESKAGVSPNVVVVQNEDGKFQSSDGHPLSKSSQVNAALWGDIDNDGSTDVYFCRRGGNEFWRQDSKAGWQDATEAFRAAGGAGSAGGKPDPNLDCTSGLLFDLDHDGDLDLFLIFADRPIEILQNTGPGGFQSAGPAFGFPAGALTARQVLALDLNHDGIHDLLILPKSGPPEQWLYDRGGRYLRESKPSDATLLYAVSDMGEALATSSEKELRADTFRMPTKTPNQARMETADLDGDGRLDIVAGQGSEPPRWALAGAPTSEGAVIEQTPPLAAWTLANLEAGRGPSLVGLPKDGSTPIIARPGDGRRTFASISLVGDKIAAKASTPMHHSNRSGIGAFIRMQVGDRQIVQCDLGRRSSPGQSLQPASFGLLGKTQADFVYIHWSNGDFQCEFPIAAGTNRRIKELDRMPEDSCPLLFAWDGSKMSFATDFLGVGGIDYLVRPGEYYTPTDPTENILLPVGGLTPKAGLLSLAIVEAAEELTLIDRLSLVAYDVPPGWKMTLDERHSALPPTVTHEPRFFRKEVTAEKAEDQAGRDVTAELAAADHRSAPPPPADVIHQGRFVSPHRVTLRFAEPIDGGPRPPMLLADGWVVYPSAPAVVSASQAGLEFKAPRLWARGKTGVWTDVYTEFGYPAGMQRSMSLPLRKLPEGTVELRIETELQVYWDRLAVAFEVPCPTAGKQVCGLESCVLEKFGSPRYSPNYDDRPFGFDFDSVHPFWPTRSPSGLFTRFGECKELATDADDAVATVGPGECLRLAFKPPIDAAAGWTRRYVVETRGWCRGMRIQTRNGQTVEPLPTTGKPSAPRDRLHRLYNTRWVGG